MIHYKIIGESSFLGVATEQDLRKYQKKHNILVFASPEEAECILLNNELYKDKWFKPFSSTFHSCADASVLAIDEEEYNELRSAIQAGVEIKEDDLPEDQPETTVAETSDETATTHEEELTAEYARAAKIREMSLACNKAITNGFNISLHGIDLHFSLAVSDQANLSSAAVQILSGATEIPYHADGDEYRNYSADDMLKIIEKANCHKTFQLAYFSCMKQWVNSLVRVKTIMGIQYGDEIPKKYQSALLKSYAEGES